MSSWDDGFSLRSEDNGLQKGSLSCFAKICNIARTTLIKVWNAVKL